MQERACNPLHWYINISNASPSKLVHQAIKMYGIYFLTRIRLQVNTGKTKFQRGHMVKTRNNRLCAKDEIKSVLFLLKWFVMRNRSTTVSFTDIEK